MDEKYLKINVMTARREVATTLNSNSGQHLYIVAIVLKKFAFKFINLVYENNMKLKISNVKFLQTTYGIADKLNKI